MKQYLKKFWLLAVFSCMLLPVLASGLGDIRVNARFLTDRMAFELHLNQNQYNDLFEVNFDFLSNVTPYLSVMMLLHLMRITVFWMSGTMIYAGSFPVRSMCVLWELNIFSVPFTP